jgi:hypothetical protein
MTIATAFLVLALASALWGVVASILMFESLRRRGQRVSFLRLRLLMPLYVHRYAEVTRAETGRPGALFYHFLLSFNLALAAALVALVLSLV